MTLDSTTRTIPKGSNESSLPKYFIISIQISTQASEEATHRRAPSSHSLCGTVLDSAETEGCVRKYRDSKCGGRACEVTLSIEAKRSRYDWSKETFVAGLPV